MGKFVTLDTKILAERWHALVLLPRGAALKRSCGMRLPRVDPPALSRVAKAELTRSSQPGRGPTDLDLRRILNEAEASKGREVLPMFESYFKTKEEVGSLYSVEDMLNPKP